MSLLIREHVKFESKDLEFSGLIEFINRYLCGLHSAARNAHCVLSDSGTITEESSLIGFPAITIREAHERPEGMDEGTLIMSGLDSESVINAIECVTGQYAENNELINTAQCYEVDNVAEKVVRIILSYTGYINRTVWRKK